MPESNADSVTDIDIFNQTITDPDAVSNDDEGTANGGDGIANPPQDDEQKKRFEYWQSEHDKIKKERDTLAFAAPIAQLLKEKPELVLKLQEEITKSVVPTEVGPKKPTPPERPIGYNEAEAYTAPESESFKFRQKYDVYREDMLRYMEEKDQLRDQIFSQGLQKQQEDERVRQAVAKLKVDLLAKGLTMSEAEEFVQYMNDPRNMTQENLVTLFKLKKGTYTPPKPKPNNAQPPIAGAEGGGDESERPGKKDFQKEFQDSLLGLGQRRKTTK